MNTPRGGSEVNSVSAGTPGIRSQLSVARSKAASIGFVSLAFSIVAVAVAVVAARMSAPVIVPLLFCVSAVIGLWCALTIRSFVTELSEQEPRILAGFASPEALAQSPAFELLRSGRRKYFILFMAHMLTGDLALALWVVLQLSKSSGVKG
jgi:hypothetical protein